MPDPGRDSVISHSWPEILNNKQLDFPIITNTTVIITITITTTTTTITTSTSITSTPTITNLHQWHILNHLPTLEERMKTAAQYFL